MAATFERFEKATEKTIQQLKDGSKNINTAKSTRFWLSVWEKWCEHNEISKEIVKFEPSELNALLERFYAEVKAKNGSDHEPESLKVMLAAIDRHLKDHGYQYSVIKDREFHSSKLVLEGKAKRLREEGRGKRPNKARKLTKDEEEELWTTGKLGIETPEALVYTVWWLLTQHFGLRGRQEHHSMKMDDFRICIDENGREYVEFAEGPTKTRQGGLNQKLRDFQPRMFATGGSRCPVSIFKEYVQRRPLQLQSNGPFYLAVKHNKIATDDIWYKAQPMGENKINSMMKNIIAGTSLETSGKKFSNHSARKTVVSKLKHVNIERAGIVKVTGHRNLQSLDDYDEANEQEQCELSLAISKRNNSSTELIPQHTSQQLSHSLSNQPAGNSVSDSVTCLRSAQQQLRNEMPLQLFEQSNSALSMNPMMMGSQAQNLMNTFNNCQVAFNFNNKSSPESAVPRAPKAKRRYYIIESDSE